MNKKITFVLLLFVLFVRCSQSSSIKVVDSNLLLGEWEVCSDAQINYPIIKFTSDSTVVFKSRADTLYRYNFILDENDLILQSYNEVISKNKIIFIDSERLILDGLLEKEGKQEYKKVIPPVGSRMKK